PTLEQITHPLTTGQQLHRSIDLNISRQKNNPNLSELLPNTVSRRQPLSAVRGRHPDVDDRQIRTMLTHQLQQLHRITRLPNHLKTRPTKQTHHSLTDQHIIVGLHNTAATHSHAFDTLLDPAYTCWNRHVNDLRKRGSGLDARQLARTWSVRGRA